MTRHKDTPGVISKISTIIYKDNLNIGTMKLYRNSKGSMATMALETDNIIPEATIKKLNELPEIHSIKIINPMREGEL